MREINLQVRIDEKEDKLLRELAEKRSVSKAFIAREMIRQKLGLQE